MEWKRNLNILNKNQNKYKYNGQRRRFSSLRLTQTQNKQKYLNYNETHNYKVESVLWLESTYLSYDLFHRF